MEFPDRNPILVLRTTVSRLARVADAGQSGFCLPTRSKGINERETSAYAKSGRSLLRFPTAGKSQAPVSGSPPVRAPSGSDLGILGEGEGILHVDSKVADRILDLAVAEQDLDGAKVAGGPVDYRCLRSAK